MKAWLATLQPRERNMLFFGVAAVLLTLGYLLAFEPFMLAKEQAGHRVKAQQALLGHLQQVAKEVKSIKASGGGVARVKGKGSLLSMIDQSSRKAGIKPAIKRLTPEGDGRVRLWLEAVAFDQLINWLATVSRNSGLMVENINFSSEDKPGLVRVNLTLRAP